MIWMSWELRTGATVREEEFGGAEGSRTPDPYNAIVETTVRRVFEFPGTYDWDRVQPVDSDSTAPQGAQDLKSCVGSNAAKVIDVSYDSRRKWRL